MADRLGPDSVKPKETAKKKVTRKLNPQEAYPRASEEPVLSDERLVDNSLKGVSSPDEILAHGYNCLKTDLDPFDNERNYNRVRPEVVGEVQDPHPDIRAYNQQLPAPGYGAKKKVLDQDSEDYGHDEYNSLDD